MKTAHPHTPRQERITCTLANKFAVFFLISWCRCIASAAVQPRRLVVRSTKSPPERSKPLCGENLIYQVRELRRNPLLSYAAPSPLGTSFLVR